MIRSNDLHEFGIHIPYNNFRYAKPISHSVCQTHEETIDNKITVLYVDDESSLLEIGKVFLEKTGNFSVIVETSAENALTLLQEQAIEIIVSDYQMPGMNGIEFLKEIRSHNNPIPFILFTGKGREEIVIEAINNGADFYLQKGGDVKSQYVELSHKIHIAVERYRINKELKRKNDELQAANEQLIAAERELIQYYLALSKKQADLEESEEKLQLKLNSVLSPDYHISELELSNIVDTQAIQNLADMFFRITGCAFALLDIRANVLVSSGWQDICTKFHRCQKECQQNCIESDLFLSDHVKEGQYTVYKCKNNMWDVITPLYIGGKHLGNLYYGQFFYEDETPDINIFIDQAERFGFDKNEYVAAFNKVPRVSRDRVEAVMAFFITYASQISNLCYSNLKLAQSISEQKRTIFTQNKSEDRYQPLFENTPIGIFRSTYNGQMLSVNQWMATMLGYDSPEDLITYVNNSGIAQALYKDPAIRSVQIKETESAGTWKEFKNFFQRKDGSSIAVGLLYRLYKNPVSEECELEGFINKISSHEI